MLMKVIGDNVSICVVIVLIDYLGFFKLWFFISLDCFVFMLVLVISK